MIHGHVETNNLALVCPQYGLVPSHYWSVHAHRAKTENAQFVPVRSLTSPSTTNPPSHPATMASRPTVSIATAEGKPSGASHPLPSVFNAPIRPDIVQYVSPIYNWTLEEEILMIFLQAGAHRYGQEQAPALRREREGW